MAIYARKRRADILRDALWQLEKQTPIKAVSPGSVARAFTEAISEQLGDMYDALEFNLAQSVLTTSSGSALDMIGRMYGMNRKTLSDFATIDAQTGAFYFYIDNTYPYDITIPSGTRIYTSVDSFIGRQIRYVTVSDVTIYAGRTRVYAAIKPESIEGVFPVPVDSLVAHDAVSPAGTIIRCNNPKPISPQPGFENDDNFRLRISKEIRVASAGTVDAVRFAGLAVAGVRDIRIRQAPYGMGTFEAMIVPEEDVIATTTLAAAKVAMDSVRPVGVRMIMTQPKAVGTDFTATILLSSGSVDANMVSAATNAVRRYLNSLLPGETLIYNKLIQEIMDVSTRIRDVQVTKFAPNGVESVRRNFTPKDNEQVIPGTIIINLA